MGYKGAWVLKQKVVQATKFALVQPLLIESVIVIIYEQSSQ